MLVLVLRFVADGPGLPLRSDPWPPYPLLPFPARRPPPLLKPLPLPFELLLRLMLVLVLIFVFRLTFVFTPEVWVPEPGGVLVPGVWVPGVFVVPGAFCDGPCMVGEFGLACRNDDCRNVVGLDCRLNEGALGRLALDRFIGIDWRAGA